MPSIIALFRGKFFKTAPRSISGGAGITFTDADDQNYVVSHNLSAGQGIVFATASGQVTIGKGGHLVKSVAGTGTKALSAGEALNSILEFTGVLTGDVIVTVPAIVDGAEWTLFNNTSGMHTVTFQGPSGTGVVVTQGKRVRVYCDGTNIVACTAEA